MAEETDINWDKEFPIARKVVSAWDPLGLIQDGGPKESYDFLTLKIFSGIKSDQSDGEISQAVIDLMGFYYQLPVEEYDQESLRQSIIAVIRDLRDRLASHST